MAATIHTRKIKGNADVLGIIFPVHNVVNGGVPSIVRSFLTKLEHISSTYIFAVCTCGGGSGDVLPNIQKSIAAKGGKLAASFTVKLPFNCPPFTPSEVQLKRFQEWNQQLDEICKTICCSQLDLFPIR